MTNGIIMFNDVVNRGERRGVTPRIGTVYVPYNHARGHKLIVLATSACSSTQGVRSLACTFPCVWEEFVALYYGGILCWDSLYIHARKAKSKEILTHCDLVPFISHKTVSNGGVNRHTHTPSWAIWLPEPPCAHFKSPWDRFLWECC